MDIDLRTVFVCGKPSIFINNDITDNDIRSTFFNNDNYKDDNVSLPEL